MKQERTYRTFTHREAVFRICCSHLDAVTAEIVRQRQILEDYITRHPEFQTALQPLTLLADAPEVARRMSRAARRVGVGPMAAVAGAMAQCAAEAGLGAGADEVIVENGGDIYIKSLSKRVIGVYAGDSPLTGRIGLEIDGAATPLGVCTSSGTVGHSLSYGQADAVVVVAPSALLADAAATAIGNRVKTAADIDGAIGFGREIAGIAGMVIIKGDSIGVWGDIRLCETSA